MIKFKPYEFFLAAVYLHPVLELKDGGDEHLLTKRLVEARCALCSFTGPLIDGFLPSSNKNALGIVGMIDHVIFKKGSGIPGVPGLVSIQEGIRAFETVLDDEIHKAPIFCLEVIGNLSTDSLLDGAHKGYADETRKVLTDACRNEIDEAGRCLAYERATASGFHILRSVEVMIRQYLRLVPSFVMPALNRLNWGEYLKLLGDNGAAKEVTDTLHNIKVNYRNPLMHPEDTLVMPEAISLFALCQGMIEGLVADMKKRGFV